MSDTQNLHPAQRLVILRETLGMSQRELAKEFQVSNAAIALWETGSRPIPGPVLKLIDIYENSFSFDPKFNTELKEHFKGSQSEEAAIALQLLEKGFSSYIEETASINSISGRLKQVLIQRLIKTLTRSRGVSAKVAQLASFLELGLPIEIRHALGTLQSRAEPLDPKLVQQILKEEYGQDPHKLFPTWKSEPLAVTSMGQVHYAKLADGREVAVKVQHPKIREILNSQMNKLDFIQSFSALLGKRESEILPEIRRALLLECDYRREALNQEKIRNILADDDRVIVPAIHRDLVRDRVLVSEYIRGESFHNFAAKASQSQRDNAAEAIMNGLMKPAFEYCLTQTDWNPGNFLFTANKVVLLDFGRIIEYPEERMRLESQFYMEFLQGNYKSAENLARRVFSKKDEDFDFEAFWGFLHQSHLHLMIDDRFHFTRAFAKSLAQQGKAYSKKHQVNMNKDAFWGMVFTTSTWGIFAELEANINYRRIALKSATMGSGFRA